MAEKVLSCIPVYYAVGVSLAFQLVVDIAYGVWSLWFIAQDHDDKIEVLRSLVGCSLASSIWQLYGGFVASVGLYGVLRRKRFMKNFISAQAFVWVCHIAIGIWCFVVYAGFAHNERIRECRAKIEESGEDDGDELCEDLRGFRTIPLAFVWLSFLLELFIQTAALYFLFRYRQFLNSYKIIDAAESLPLAETRDSTGSLTAQRPEATDSAMSLTVVESARASLMEAGRLPSNPAHAVS